MVVRCARCQRPLTIAAVQPGEEDATILHTRWDASVGAWVNSKTGDDGCPSPLITTP